MDTQCTLARQTVNRYIRRVQRAFRWGVANEMVDNSVWQALKSVEPLKRGREKSRETEPVTSVSLETVQKTVLVKFYLLSGGIVVSTAGCTFQCAQQIKHQQAAFGVAFTTIGKGKIAQYTAHQRCRVNIQRKHRFGGFP